MKKSLTVLDSITIKTPCHESWEKMSGDSRSRFCKSCALSVTNISELTREEAAAFLTQGSNKRVCIRYRRDFNGAPQFKAKGERSKGIRRVASLMFAGIFALFGISFTSPSHADDAGASPVATENPQDFITGDYTMGEAPTLPEKTPAPTATPHEREFTMGRMKVEVRPLTT